MKLVDSFTTDGFLSPTILLKSLLNEEVEESELKVPKCGGETLKGKRTLRSTLKVAASLLSFKIHSKIELD